MYVFTTIYWLQLSYHPLTLQGLLPVRGWGVNTLGDRMEKENSTKDVCNAIRMNKGLFNEEASLPLTLPLPIQLFHYSEREVRAAGLQSWVYWRLRLTRSKPNQIISQRDICYDFTSCKSPRFTLYHHCSQHELQQYFSLHWFRSIWIDARCFQGMLELY